VFEKLNQHPAVKPFNNDIGLPKELDQHLRTYYDTAVRENRYYSEDWTFCENWRDIGGKIWVDKRVLLRHTGTYVFDFAAQEPLYQALHEIAVQNGTVPASVVAAQPAQPATPVTETPVTETPVPTVLATNEKIKTPVDKKPVAKKKSKTA